MSASAVIFSQNLIVITGGMGGKHERREDFLDGPLFSTANEGVEILDASNKEAEWERWPDMIQKRYSHSLTFWDSGNMLIVAGGQATGGVYGSVEVLDLKLMPAYRAAKCSPDKDMTDPVCTNFKWKLFPKAIKFPKAGHAAVVTHAGWLLMLHGVTTDGLTPDKTAEAINITAFTSGDVSTEDGEYVHDNGGKVRQVEINYFTSENFQPYKPGYLGWFPHKSTLDYPYSGLNGNVSQYLAHHTPIILGGGWRTMFTATSVYKMWTNSFGVYFLNEAAPPPQSTPPADKDYTISLGFVLVVIIIFCTPVCIIVILLWVGVVRPMNKQSAAELYRSKQRESELVTALLSEQRIASDVFIDPNALSIGTPLTTGAYGLVRRGRFHGARVAVKQMLSDIGADEKLLEDTKREAGVMSKMRHPHITAFIGICEKDDVWYIVSEFCERGSVADVLKKSPNWEFRMRLILGAAKGLMYLHSRFLTFMPHYFYV